MFIRRIKASLTHRATAAKDNCAEHYGWEFWLCSVWLPFGLFVQLTGFFWLPDTHLYKVNVVNCLLLAALISLFNLKTWRLALRSSVILLILTYLLHMSAIPVIRHNEEPFECAQWSAYIALYILALSYRMRLSTQNWQRLLLASTTICAAAIIYGLCNEVFFLRQWSATYRLTGSGTLYNPLRSGQLFGFFYVVALWLSLASTTPRLMRSTAISTAIICLIGTIFTGSRAPLLALAASSLFLLSLTPLAHLRWRYLLVCSLAPAALIFLFWERLVERGLSLRPEIWAEAIKLWEHNPWLGAGHNAQLQIRLSHIDDTFYDTHNIILAVLFYGGVIGVMLFSALHISAFYRAFSRRNTLREAALACALMIYGMIALQFDGGSIISRPNESWLLLWFPITFWLNMETHRINAIAPTRNLDPFKLAT